MSAMWSKAENYFEKELMTDRQTIDESEAISVWICKHAVTVKRPFYRDTRTGIEPYLFEFNVGDRIVARRAVFEIDGYRLRADLMSNLTRQRSKMDGYLIDSGKPDIAPLKVSMTMINRYFRRFA